MSTRQAGWLRYPVVLLTNYRESRQAPPSLAVRQGHNGRMVAV